MLPKDDILTQFQDSATQLKLGDSILMLRMFPPQEEECRLTLWCRPNQYSASAIARAVEDCDAHLINLNVTSDRTSDGDLVVELRINHRHGESVARSLERYGYTVASIGGSDLDEDMAAEAKDRINELLHYLNM